MKKILPIVFIGFLSACGTLDYFSDEEESVLEGERLSLYDFEKTLQQDPNTQFGMDGTEGNVAVITLPDILQGGEDTNMSLAAPWANQFWPQVGGYPNHAMKHVAFTSGKPKKLWSSSIGAGGTKRMPLTSAPIMADGKVFALNNDAEIVAFSAEKGKKLWTREILKQGEDEVVIGGGLGFSGGRLYATNGFNEVLALNPDNGEILWRADTKTPVRAAPAAIPGRVFVTTLDNETIAFDGRSGEKLWSHRGLNSEAGLIGDTTPAVTKDAVIATYGSGEVYALQINTGLELWGENLSPLARNTGQSSLTDIRALPVVDEGIVIAASYNNRMNAIELRAGTTLWQISIGAESTPWVSGNRVFVIESQGTLISINRDNGDIIWQSPLDPFEDMDDRDDPIKWSGPVLAGGQLMVFGSHGVVRTHNPVSGEIVNEWDVRDPLSLPVAIANETLYTLSDNGRLTAWR